MQSIVKIFISILIFAISFPMLTAYGFFDPISDYETRSPPEQASVNDTDLMLAPLTRDKKTTPNVIIRKIRNPFYRENKQIKIEVYAKRMLTIKNHGKFHSILKILGNNATGRVRGSPSESGDF